MSLSSINKPLRDAVWKRDEGRCRYCGLLQVGQAAVFHIDHIHPRSLGGPTSLENLALQCPHCSLRKSNTVEAPDPVTGMAVRMFHPLRDRWEDHFVLRRNGIIEGRTPIGRSTAAALQFNERWAVSARSLQIALRWIDIGDDEGETV